MQEKLKISKKGLHFDFEVLQFFDQISKKVKISLSGALPKTVRLDPPLTGGDDVNYISFIF